jgi:diguanylate cyclase (GGDEF)-like protein
MTSEASNNPAIERVMNCQHLPSLPGVAMRVLELTADKNVSSVEIATTIQNDPALTTKVLRTVNSSFYGLPTPCPSIKRATSLLGMNTVKSIVLGFSLVESTKKAGLNKRFDMLSYWRRAVYSAAGARTIAQALRRCDPEEAFIGAMVQDIGVLAFAATLKEEYDAVIAEAAADHEGTSEAERKRLGADHSQVGARLAERWRLPPQVIECIRWHHEPDRSSPALGDLLRAVAAGGLAAAVLADTNDPKKLGRFVVSMRNWGEMDALAARDLLVQINESASQLAKSMDLKTGDSADLSSIMSRAHEQLLATQEDIQRETQELRRSNDELAKKTVTDALTGAFNRAHFDGEVAAAYARSNAERTPLTVIFSDADKFKSVNDTHGHQAGDAVLVELARRLRDALGTLGTVCRYGGEEFAIIVPGADEERGMRLAEALRRKIAAMPFDLSALRPGLSLPVTVSLGVAAHDPAAGSVFAKPEDLVHLADLGVYAAKKAGRNRVCRGAAESEAPGVRVLAIEDDPLAARLLGFLFEKHSGFTLSVESTAEAGLAAIRAPGTRPDLVLCDLGLPGMDGLQALRTLRGEPAISTIPFVIVSASGDPAAAATAAAAGADSYIDKSELVSGFDRWVVRLAELAAGRGRAVAA